MKRSEENFKAATKQYKEPDYCTALSLGVQAGWRLPTIDELEALYDSNCFEALNGQGADRSKRSRLLQRYAEQFRGSLEFLS